MAVSTNTFRDFLGFAIPGTDGTKAVGLLQITKIPADIGKAFTIPENTYWAAAGRQFISPERWEIPESKTDPTDIAVIANGVGEDGNLPANQEWSIPIFGLLVANPAPFTGGTDPVPATPGLYYGEEGITPTEASLQRALNVAEKVVKGMIGLTADEALDTTDSRVEQAVLLLAMFRFQNNTVQQRELPVPDNLSPSPQQVSYFRAKIYPALLNQVSGLISHLTKYKRQINGEDS